MIEVTNIITNIVDLSVMAELMDVPLYVQTASKLSHLRNVSLRTSKRCCHMMIDIAYSLEHIKITNSLSYRYINGTYLLNECIDEELRNRLIGDINEGYRLQSRLKDIVALYNSICPSMRYISLQLNLNESKDGETVIKVSKALANYEFDIAYYTDKHLITDRDELPSASYNSFAIDRHQPGVPVQNVDGTWITQNNLLRSNAVWR